jgi:tRNA modification GTPase
MLRLKHSLEPGRAVFGELIEPCAANLSLRQTRGLSITNESLAESDLAGRPSSQHGRIDEVVVTYFARPHSYTTDDIIEISAHGSPVVLGHIVELALRAGARLAQPGEFTMRAFLNGRIDLTQAEAVRDLIDSQTLYQAKVAAQQLEGALSRRLQPTKRKLVELIASLEAGIDFAEDDVSVLPTGQILEQIAGIRSPLEELARSFSYGKIVHEGLTLAIVGRPNVGKSSLFNRLVERERAIVTATPGTTRDLVTETVSLGGIPIRLVDTAGIRRALDEADLVLVVLDASEPMSSEDETLLQQVEQRAAIVVQNKADLVGAESPSKPGPAKPEIRTSAISGQGVSELRESILRHLTGESGSGAESGFLTNARHQKLVQDSIIALDSAGDASKNRIPHEMVLLDLYNALKALDEITGATTTDDILNLIFSRFCIGK